MRTVSSEQRVVSSWKDKSIFSSEPIGEASVRGIRAGLCSARRRQMIKKMRAMYEQGTV